MSKFNVLKFAEKLISCSPRQLEGEKKARRLIVEILRNNGIDFKLQNFQVPIPVFDRCYLKADGQNIECLPTAFVSGPIKSKDNLISSLADSKSPNINFNPHCPHISRATFYFAPSVAVSFRELKRILAAKRVKGFVKVRRLNHGSCNILAGNMKNPKTISFVHYDSIGKGAVDNASGVAAVLGAIIGRPDALGDNLVVLAGAEELSFDQPNYWGYAFRVFEKKYIKLMAGAKKIIAVDCVGNGVPRLITDPEIVFLTFPIVNLKKFSKKISVLSTNGDFHRLLRVYHSDLDDLGQVNKKYLDLAAKKFLEAIGVR